MGEYFRALKGELVRRSRIEHETPYLKKAVDACLYKEGDLIGQGSFLNDHGEIFIDTIVWRPYGQRRAT